MKVLDIFGDTSKNWDKKLSEREDSDQDVKKSEEPNGNNNDSRDQYVDPELQRTMSYAKSQFPSYKDPQLAFDKWVQNNINRSEERDLEHDEEIENLYRKLNQVTTDLQRIKELQRTAKLGEERQRLDPKCWKVYRKVGTKIKGGVRVNDCKKIGEDQFEGHGVLKSTDTTHDIFSEDRTNWSQNPQHTNNVVDPFLLQMQLRSTNDSTERQRIKNQLAAIDADDSDSNLYTKDELDFFNRAEHDPKTGLAIDRSVPGRTTVKMSNRTFKPAPGPSKKMPPNTGRNITQPEPMGKIRPRFDSDGGITEQDVSEEKDSFGYQSYTIEQLQRMFRNGTWEPMSDLKPNSHVQIRNTTTGGRKTVHVKPNNTKQFEAKSAKVEAWGYMYNNQDRRIVWRKIFPSGEAAYRWADQRNATVLGTRETEDSNTEPRKPLFKESTVSIRRTTKMSTLGERKQQYHLLDALGRNIAVFESARRAQHIYTALTRLREALEVANANPTDRVTMDIPLLLRVLEYAKEDAKTDMDLHDVTENLIDLSKNGQTLSMKDYESVVNIPEREQTLANDQVNEVGDRYWCKNERRWKDRS